MKHPRTRFLRTLPATLALMLAAAAAQAQQPADQGAPAQSAQPDQQQTMPPTDPAMPSAPASPTAQADSSASAQDSSDQNVPPATARKQAAEIARGDPPRWFREDTTPAARLRTIQKEIAAGLQEAQGNCRRQPTAERSACLKEARAIYQKEMAQARTRAMADTAR